MRAKYLVLKWDDIDRYLPEDLKSSLYSIMATIGLARNSEGKGQNFYWVVNKDEPYAHKVRDLIFEHEGYIDE